MKLLAFTFLLLLAKCQSNPVTTQDLLAAQAQLTIGHEFAEEYLVLNRNALSDVLISMEAEIVSAFLDSYAEIKNLGIETRRQMEEFTEPSFCKDTVRARWELQVTRYGQRLSKCLGDADFYLKLWTNTLNNLHDQSRVYKVFIPNAGVHVLSDASNFLGRDNFSQAINDRARDLFFGAQAMRAEFADLNDEIFEMR